MTRLQEVNNQEFLKELQKRVKTNQIPEKEVAKVLAKAEAEAEAWKKDYELAAQDVARNKEAEEWDNLEESNN